MLFFLAFGLTILWFLYNDLNSSYLAECQLKGIPESECNLVDKVLDDFRSAHIFWLVIICLCFFISNISRSLRWQQLLESLGYSTRWSNAFQLTFSQVTGIEIIVQKPQYGQTECQEKQHLQQ